MMDFEQVITAVMVQPAITLQGSHNKIPPIEPNNSKNENYKD